MGGNAYLGTDFDYGNAGTHIEAGLGGQLTVGQNINLYGEVNWQQRVSKGGTNGISFDVGTNIKF